MRIKSDFKEKLPKINFLIILNWSIFQMIFDEEFGLFTQPCNKNRIWHKGFSRKCSLKTALNILFGFIPILHWLPKYKIREYLLNDLIGGFTVGIMHVPQGNYISLRSIFVGSIK